jgi:heme/copper-type cytochrome/quinol oxidase subunit 2
LIFSSVRTIALSAVWIGFHFAQKYFHSMFHTVSKGRHESANLKIFLLLSTIFWIVSGVLIHQLWGYIECGGVGRLQGGLNECHELKIIEILAWVLAAVSILATVPVISNSMKRYKNKMSHHKTATSG